MCIRDSLGNALKLEHSGAATIEAFAGNVAQIFARHRETVEGLGKLFHVYVNYPANVMAGLMNLSLIHICSL